MPESASTAMTPSSTDFGLSAMGRESSDTHHKALAVNLDQSKYGTFAEIGAGQEVARWFFRVGGAAGTMAKAMSAYDMTFSDAIYGTCERYVSRQRVDTMLEREFGLLVERLDEKRGEKTRFFAFANTCATKSFSRKSDGHGWLGVRFQSTPRTEPSTIIVHCRLWDEEPVLQQEALGILGVNLVYGGLYLHTDPEKLLQSLMDGLNVKRMEVDLIDFSGPAFENVDNRLMALELVEHGMTDAAMFLASGELVQAADILYKKNILVHRGSFRPITLTNMDMLRCATAHFVQDPRVHEAGGEVVTLLEMTLRNLSESGSIDHRDFLERVDILGTLGYPVLISNFGEFHRLSGYLFRHTKAMIGVVMGVPTLRLVFDEQYYSDLAGGILESFGRLFKNDLKLFVYPEMDRKTGAIISGTNMRVPPHLRHLHAYLSENRLIESVRDYDERCLPIFSREVLLKLQSGDDSWVECVPEQAAKLIQERGLLGYTAGKATPKQKKK